MKFSVDSNIIIAAVSPTHRLHVESVKLIRDRHDAEFVLSLTALKESSTTFRNRINQTVTEKVMPILPPLLDKKMSKIDRHGHLVKSFAQMKLDNPGIASFIDLIYDDILKFISDNDCVQLPSFLSQRGVYYSQNLYQKIEDMHSTNIHLISLDHKHRENIQKVTMEVYFKDAHDKMIIEDLMTNLPKIVPIEFITGDKEFSKKIGQVYGKCLRFFGLDDSCFTCIFVK
jgi:hypothetical protein